MQQQDEAEQIISNREEDRLSKITSQEASDAAAHGCVILNIQNSTKDQSKGGFFSCQPHHRRAFLIGIVMVSLLMLFIAAAHSHFSSSAYTVEAINSVNLSEKVLPQPSVPSSPAQTPNIAKTMNVQPQTEKKIQNVIQVQNEKVDMQADKEAPRPDWETKLPKAEEEEKDKRVPLTGLSIANPIQNMLRSKQSAKSEHQQTSQEMKNRQNEIYEKQKEISQQASLKVAKEQQQNILKNVLKNPYLQQVYANITSNDLVRARKWRYIVNMNPGIQTPVTLQERQYYEKKYQISKYQELTFCIVVPTFNNKPRRRYYRNIRSILMQDYTNFKVIVIDDASTDGTGNAILDVLKNQTKLKPDQYRVIVQKERHFAMPNLRFAAKSFCSPTDIFMIVDGDDELLGKQVLKLFNAVFQKEGVWFVYSNFLGSNSKLGYSRPFHPSIIQNNEYRKYTFAVSHLRAYYTQLFLNIDQKDLQDENGKYLTSANDMAICIPALQQAHKRITYIPQLTYFYNFNTGLNVHKARLQEQRQNNLRIREKKSYQPLDQLFPE